MIKILVVGVGRMGFAHALALSEIDQFEIVGLVARDFSNWPHVTEHFADVRLYNDYKTALAHTKPDAVSISSYTDTHADYACLAMEAGADVFIEKPLATNFADVKKVIACAQKTKRKLLVGLLLRHHIAWQKFTELCRTLSPPLSFKFTSSQYSIGQDWQTHKNILNAGLSPVVDVGIHYLDMMEQLCQSEVATIDARGDMTSDQVTVENDIKLNITYQNGTSLNIESAFGPKVDPDFINIRKAQSGDDSVEMSEDNRVLYHHNGLSEIFEFSPEQLEATLKNQLLYFLKIIEQDLNLDQHHNAVYCSHKIALASENQLNNFNKAL